MDILDTVLDAVLDIFDLDAATDILFKYSDDIPKMGPLPKPDLFRPQSSIQIITAVDQFM